MTEQTADAKPLTSMLSPAPNRFAALDGLRGIAALVVVVHHCLLCIPVLGASYIGVHVHGWSAWMAYSPLHVPLWGGGEAVYLFFLLSGFVLALPATRQSIDYWGYYPKRLVRLYLPIWASVAGAILVFQLVPRGNHPGQSWWLGSHTMSLSLGSVGNDLVVVKQTDALNAVLWSLKPEIQFSVLLPLYVVLSRRARSAWWMKIVLCLIATYIGAVTGRHSLMYLPMFAIGTVVAFERDRLTRYSDHLRSKPWVQMWIPWALLIAAWALLSLRWMLMSGGKLGAELSAVALVAQVFGALIILVLFLYWQKAIRLGERTPVQWLGRRSFSLYLVHEPLVVSVGILLGHRWSGATVLIALPFSLLAADCFYRLIERPSHKIAMRLGMVTSRRRRTFS